MSGNRNTRRTLPESLSLQFSALAGVGIPVAASQALCTTKSEKKELNWYDLRSSSTKRPEGEGRSREDDETADSSEGGEAMTTGYTLRSYIWRVDLILSLLLAEGSSGLAAPKPRASLRLASHGVRPRVKLVRGTTIMKPPKKTKRISQLKIHRSRFVSLLITRD